MSEDLNDTKLQLLEAMSDLGALLSPFLLADGSEHMKKRMVEYHEIGRKLIMTRLLTAAELGVVACEAVDELAADLLKRPCGTLAAAMTEGRNNLVTAIQREFPGLEADAATVASFQNIVSAKARVHESLAWAIRELGVVIALARQNPTVARPWIVQIRNQRENFIRMRTAAEKELANCN